MKTWNSSDIGPGRRNQSSIKALARKLRDRLNGYLEEAEDAAPERAQSPGVAALATTVPLDARGQGQSSGQISESREQANRDPRSLFEPAGPPEEWLRMVQEGAPELLSTEEGGIPWHGSPSAATGSQPRNELGEVPSVSLPSSQSSPRKSGELLTTTTRASLHAAESSATWFERMRRRLTPGVFHPREESGQRLVRPELAYPVSQLHTPRESENEISPTLAQVPQFGGRDSQRVLANRGRTEATPRPHWRELVRRSVERPLPNAPVHRSAPEAHLAWKMAQVTLSQNRNQQNENQQDEKRQPLSPTVSHEATPPVRLPRFEQRSVAISTEDSETRTSGPSNPSDLQPRTRNRRAPEDRSTERRALGRHESAATQRSADPWPLLVMREAEPGFDDSWPALPESQPMATLEWALDLRRSEHLHALELEQRGGN
jgi:hypothetical protein